MRGVYAGAFNFCLSAARVLNLRILSPQERGYGTSPWSGGGFEFGPTGLMLSRRCRFRTVSSASAICSRMFNRRESVGLMWGLSGCRLIRTWTSSDPRGTTNWAGSFSAADMAPRTILPNFRWSSRFMATSASCMSILKCVKHQYARVSGRAEATNW